MWVIFKHIKSQDLYANSHVFEPEPIPVRRMLRPTCICLTGSCEFGNMPQVEVSGKASDEPIPLCLGVSKLPQERLADAHCFET